MRILFGILVVAAVLACAVGSVAEVDGERASGLGGLDFRQVVKVAKAKVFPAVVFVKCIKESHESGKKSSQEVAGSGVLISAKGELLTNWHVVDKATEVRCLLHDGRNFDAEVLGTDKDTDLALVKLKTSDRTGALPFAQLGDSDKLKEGDFVMAMGAPWGLSRSVSIGIISCTRRYLPGSSEYNLWIQTDAAISPGNSGGPLVNTDGQVVGINTLGVLFGGDMGFANPSATIKHIVAQIREHGKVNWSWTGLQLQPLKDFDSNVYFEADEIFAIRPRGGSILKRLGLTPWIRRKDAAYLKELREQNKQTPGVYRMPPGIPMSVICIMILIFGGSLFLLQSENDEQVASLKEETLVLKAAFVQLDEVVQFNRLFPKAWFTRMLPKAVDSPLCFIATPNRDAFDISYRLELPKYTIQGSEVTFHGKAEITANRIVFTDHSARSEVVSELTIDELKREIAGKLGE